MCSFDYPKDDNDLVGNIVSLSTIVERWADIKFYEILPQYDILPEDCTITSVIDFLNLCVEIRNLQVYELIEDKQENSKSKYKLLKRDKLLGVEGNNESIVFNVDDIERLNNEFDLNHESYLQYVTGQISDDYEKKISTLNDKIALLHKENLEIKAKLKCANDESLESDAKTLHQRIAELEQQLAEKEAQLAEWQAKQDNSQQSKKTDAATLARLRKTFQEWKDNLPAMVKVYAQCIGEGAKERTEEEIKRMFAKNGDAISETQLAEFKKALGPKHVKTTPGASKTLIGE